MAKCKVHDSVETSVALKCFVILLSTSRRTTEVLRSTVHLLGHHLLPHMRYHNNVLLLYAKYLNCYVIYKYHIQCVISATVMAVSTLKMEATASFETSVILYRTTPRHIQQDILSKRKLSAIHGNSPYLESSHHDTGWSMLKNENRTRAIWGHWKEKRSYGDKTLITLFMFVW